MAGFKDILSETISETISVTFEFDSAQDYTKFNQDIVALIRSMLAKESNKRKVEIWKAVTDQANLQFTDPITGRVILVNEAICIVGLKQ